MSKTLASLFTALLLGGTLAATAATAAEQRVALSPAMLAAGAPGNPAALIDEQAGLENPPKAAATSLWLVPEDDGNTALNADFDLGAVKHLSSLWVYDLQGKGDLIVSAGAPEAWVEVARYDCSSFRRWKRLKLETATQHLRITRSSYSANVGEIVLYEETDAKKLPFPTPKAAAVADGDAKGAPMGSGKLHLTPQMVTNESGVGDPSVWFDEQDLTGSDATPTGKPKSGGWNKVPQSAYPLSCYVDLGREVRLSAVWFYDTNGVGDVEVQTGKPGEWKPLCVESGNAYQAWKKHEVLVSTRYVRFVKTSGGGNFEEIVLYEMPEKQYQAGLAKEKARQLAMLQAANRELVDTGTLWGKQKLVDEIDVANPGDHLTSSEEGSAHRVENILGRPCMVLPNVEGGAPTYYAWRIAQYKLLEPLKPYLLTIEYPGDKPRTMMFINEGAEEYRGVHTGNTLGDVIYTYTDNNVESLDLPMSGKYETWQSFFYLHQRVPDLAMPRGSSEKRSLNPAEDGFWVVLAQPEAKSLPMSAGAAVARIRLFEIDDATKLDLPIRRPPAGLPQRHLFWREEMADGVVGNKDKADNGYDDRLDWYRGKARLMHFLGMDTFGKDLLEFGANQGWDSSLYGGNDWVYMGHEPGLWERIVDLLAEEKLNLLPYYEYTGSKGKNGLGFKKRARPLGENEAYTHIKWAETSNADLTDPETLEDFAKMLDCTIFRFKDRGNILGAWIRTRPSQLPISFADATMARFDADTDRAKPTTREALQGDKAMLQAYYDWWFGRRKKFLTDVRDILRGGMGKDDAFVLFTADASEPGITLPGSKAVVAERPADWKARLEALDPKLRLLDAKQVRDEKQYLESSTSMRPTWGSWEWQHSIPPADPQHYQDVPGVIFSYSMSRRFTVDFPEGMDLYRTPAGLATIRHFALNENVMAEHLGYFVCEMERNGPYSMMIEALAMANGDPNLLGYLCGNSLNRGFPEYARRFNQAYLSLPALPSTVLDGAASDAEVVVRQIVAKPHGAWLAIVNTGIADKAAVTVTLPTGTKTAVDAATGEALKIRNGTLELKMYPYELRSIHLQ